MGDQLESSDMIKTLDYEISVCATVMVQYYKKYLSQRLLKSTENCLLSIDHSLD